MKEKLTQEQFNQVLISQRNEITEYHIYSKLVKRIQDPENSQVLQKIADDELRHYKFWKTVTGQDVKASKIKVFFYYWISIIFGLTFGIKLMERGEEKAQLTYQQITDNIPGAEKILQDEEKHEHELIGLIEEEHLKYVGSVVLGLNDALVELTGTLAGLSFALKNTGLIAMAGLITGIAASFSMAASEYLSTKSEEGDDALKSSIYTGLAYIVTVILLVLPFLILQGYLIALISTIIIGILIIFVFNFYISIAKEYNFKKRFLEMAGISLGVALLSFVIGYLVRVFLGVDI